MFTGSIVLLSDCVLLDYTAGCGSVDFCGRLLVAEVDLAVSSRVINAVPRLDPADLGAVQDVRLYQIYNFIYFKCIVRVSVVHWGFT